METQATLIRLIIKIWTTMSIVLLLTGNLFAACNIIPPDTSYEIKGNYSTKMDTLENRRDKDDALVYIFRPAEKKEKCPVVIICHQFGNRSPENYSFLINNLVSKGTIVLYPSSVIISSRDKNSNKFKVTLSLLMDAFKKVNQFADSSRLGFVAQGFGGGVAPLLMYKLVTERQWGKNGTYLYIASPWYMNTLDLRQMANFPDFVNMVVQVFDNDIVNDPEIAIDIFNSLSIPDAHKRFIVMHSDKKGKCELNASFSIPEGSITGTEEVNYLDVYGVNRIVDALEKWTFYKDSSSQALLFGKRGLSEIEMGKWPDGSNVKPMTITDSAHAGLIDKKLLYINPWRSLRNQRLDQTGFRYTRDINRNYKLKTVQSISTFLRTQIKKAMEDSAASEYLVNPIKGSYGEDGVYTMQADTVMCPYKSTEHFSSQMPVYIFTPVELREPSPVIVFVHGYIGQDPIEFEPFLRHIVSKGYTVIYPTYPFLPKADTPEKVVDKYEFIYAGITKAARILSWRIDTTRVGFFGQSFGAGTIPAVAYKTLVGKKWGSKGKFMFITAPWYSFDITPDQVSKFPKDTKMLMQIYDDDQINDHAMAVDLFCSLPIAETEKDFMTIYSDSLDHYRMQANHFVPYGPANIYGDLNAHDYYAVYRMFDALAEYAFTGNPAAKNVALGNGSDEQIFMGMWSEDKHVRKAAVTDKPKALHTTMKYLYGWENELNPRRTSKRGRE